MEDFQYLTATGLTLEAMLLATLGLFALWAAASDLRRYLIPNRLVVAIAFGGIVWQLAAGGGVGAALSVAAIVLAAGFAAFALNILGAGDVKLLSAVALWAGPAEIVPLLLQTLIFGGALALFWVLSRPLRHTLVLAGLDIRAEPPRAIPYGVAIAGGTLALIVRLWPGT